MATDPSNRKPGRPGTAVYNILVRTARVAGLPVLGGIWELLWKSCPHAFSGPVATTVHGHRVRVNFGYTYPVFARRYPSLNDPLVELVYQCYLARQRPVTLLDAGAAIGDTILLLMGNCPGMVGDFVCVEGDTEFYGYLVRNLAPFPNGICIHGMVSAAPGTERSLVRIHGGTASAQGTERIPVTTLDALISGTPGITIDILKVDVDGFDGRALAGAKGLLTGSRPAVIFEWHPILCERTENDWMEHFDVLTGCGYDRFVWFTKYGEFSHFMTGLDRRSVELLASLCLGKRYREDWHYDVVALAPGHVLDVRSLAETGFARNRRSPF